MAIDHKLSGNRIRAIRKARKLTAAKLAEAIGINEESLLHIECGSKKPSLQTFYSIADVLDCSMDFLSGRTNKPDDYIPTPEIEERGLTDKQAAMVKEIAKSVAAIVQKNG